MHYRIWVLYIWKKFLQQVCGADAQTGSIDTWMAANVLVMVDHISINEKSYPVVLIIHQSQNADGAGGDVEELFHVFRLGKRQTRGADL